MSFEAELNAQIARSSKREKEAATRIADLERQLAEARAELSQADSRADSNFDRGTEYFDRAQSAEAGCARLAARLALPGARPADMEKAVNAARSSFRENGWGYRDCDILDALRAALLHLQPAAVANETFAIEHDGFIGTVQGGYVTREGRRGIVLQQLGTRVVHVYGEKWLTPASSPRKEGSGDA